MAQKKGLIYRLTMGKDNLPDFTPDKLPKSRFGLFKDVLFGRAGALVKINLFTLLFALPLVAIIVIFYLMKMSNGLIIPYSGNMGLGYPIEPNAEAIGQAAEFALNLQMYLWMIPAIVILAIGLSGAFYVMRRLVWGEGVTVAANFFRGIKMNFFPFLWSSLFVGISIFLVLFNITAYGTLTEIPQWLSIMGIIISIIQFVIVLSMAIFLTTQAVTYKLKTWPLIKNSFLFAMSLLVQNIFILIVSILPFILVWLAISVPFLNMILIMLLLLFGFSFVILIWTVYAHWAYDRFINDRVEGAVKNRNMYSPSEEDKKKREQADLKAKNIRFNNPVYLNKKISSIDEGLNYTPLSPTFSRADLERLEEEKALVKQEIDAEYEAETEEERLIREENEKKQAEKLERERKKKEREALKRAQQNENVGQPKQLPGTKNKPAVKINTKKKK